MAFNPAASSVTPEVVEGDELVAANAALWTVAVAAQVVLAPVAGLIVAAAGPGVAFGANAASYLVSAAVLLRLSAGRRPADIAGRGWSAVVAGVHAVGSHPLLSRLAVVQVLASLSAGATGGLLAGVGNPAVAFAALGAYGVGTSTGMIAYQATLQTEVPTELRDRAFALYDVLWNAARLVSLGLGGLLADAVGIRAVYVIGGVLLLFAGAVGWSGPRSVDPGRVVRTPQHSL